MRQGGPLEILAVVGPLAQAFHLRGASQGLGEERLGQTRTVMRAHQGADLRQRLRQRREAR